MMSSDEGSAMTTEPEPQPDLPVWRTVETRRDFRNRWVGVLADTVQLPNGQRYEYTRLEPAGIGVGVIGFDDAGNVLLEREYRHGVGEVIWQLPGGLADSGEPLLEAGLRELREETGFAPARVNAETVRYLGAVWDNPALGVGQSHIYAAWGLVRTGDTRRDAAEMVSLHWQSPAWLRAAVRDGAIKDRVVVAAVAFLLLHGWLE
jgi:ADP-ribose pyrophosphatase